jgi:hypothetical protein
MEVQPAKRQADEYVWVSNENQPEVDLFNEFALPELSRIQRFRIEHTGGVQEDKLIRVKLSQLESIAASVEQADVQDDLHDYAKRSIVSATRGYDSNASVSRDARARREIAEAFVWVEKSTLVLGVVAVSSLTFGILDLTVIESGSPSNTSATTIISPEATNNLITPNEISPPYAKDPVGHGISAIVYCGFMPSTNSNKMVIDPKSYASVYRPIDNQLTAGGAVNGVVVHEIDEFSATDVDGWSNGFVVSGDQVTLGGATNGYDVPAAGYTGKDSPNGSFTLEPGYVAEGQFGLLDYTIEHDKNGKFYLGTACDAQETQRLLAHDNSNNT